MKQAFIQALRLIAYLMVLGACGLYLGLNLRADKIESSVLSLLPTSALGNAPAHLTSQLLERLNQQVIFLVSLPEPQNVTHDTQLPLNAANAQDNRALANKVSSDQLREATPASLTTTPDQTEQIQATKQPVLSEQTGNILQPDLTSYSEQTALSEHKPTANTNQAAQSDQTHKLKHAGATTSDLPAGAQAAQSLVSLLQATPYFKEVVGQRDESYFSEWGRFFFEHRLAFITPDIRARLESGEISEYVLEQLYSSFSGVSSRELMSDPLLLTRQEQLALSAGSAMTLDHNFLAARDENGQIWYFIHAEIAGSSFALSDSTQVVSAIDAACAQIKAQFPEVNILKRGAVFYSAHAAAGAYHDLTFLGSSTVLLVLLLIYWAFRSFIPLLTAILSIGAGLVMGLTATLAVFGQIHSFTLIVSLSVIGMACDYTLYFMAVHAAGIVNLKPLYRALISALCTTAIAYVVMLFTPFPGIKQMAVLAIAALSGSCGFVLCVAPYLTRYLPSSTNFDFQRLNYLKFQLSFTLRCWLNRVTCALSHHSTNATHSTSTGSTAHISVTNTTSATKPTKASNTTISHFGTKAETEVGAKTEVKAGNEMVAPVHAETNNETKLGSEPEAMVEAKTALVTAAEVKAVPVAVPVTVAKAETKAPTETDPGTTTKNNGIKLSKGRLVLVGLALLIAVTGVVQLKTNDDVTSFADMPPQLRADEQQIAKLTGQVFDQRYLLLYASSGNKVLELWDKVQSVLGNFTTFKAWPLNSPSRQQQDYALVQDAYAQTIELLSQYAAPVNFEPLPQLQVLSLEEYLAAPVSEGFRLLHLQTPEYQALLIPIGKINNLEAFTQSMLALNTPTTPDTTKEDLWGSKAATNTTTETAKTNTANGKSADQAHENPHAPEAMTAHTLSATQVTTANPVTPSNQANPVPPVTLDNQDTPDLSTALHQVSNIEQVAKVTKIAQAAHATDREYQHVVLLDTKSGFDQLFTSYRSLMARLLALVLGVILLSMLLRFGLRLGTIAFLPTVLSIFTTLGLLGWCGIEVNLFVMFALIMILGVGINYSLFFLSKAANPKHSWFGITLACLTTEFTLGILAFSSTQAVRSFGLTLLLGVLIAYLLAPLVRPQH